jgi:dihydropyrimidinase
VTGKPVTVLVRGVPVVEEGALRVKPGFGHFVPRSADPARAGKPIEDAMPWLDS